MHLASQMFWGTLTILGVAFVLLCARIIIEAYYYQGHRAKRLERDLGFEHGSAYPRCNGRIHLGVLTIRRLEPGGIFERAGFREGDILPWLTITELFKLLHRNRGREVEVHVIDGGNGPRLAARPERLIRISLPGAMLTYL